ncbi:MAG TPA: STAS domain-containing protein [Ktedonobacteraceae bacterium]|nr:STAS domain-containing protein [Ktedonobacteraceae bacterium]
MDIQAAQVNNIAILKLAGRFDAFSAHKVEQLLKSITTSVPANAIIDLANVTFIDSAGLAILLQGLKRCQQQQGNLYLCNLKQPTRIIFELTRFDIVFSIFDSQEIAIQNFIQKRAYNVSNHS